MYIFSELKHINSEKGSVGFKAVKEVHGNKMVMKPRLRRKPDVITCLRGSVSDS